MVFPFISANINKPPPGDVDDLGSPHVDGVTPDITREILSYITANDTHIQWVKVAAALKHQYVDDAATGYKLFAEWSARVNSNFDESECARKWESFNPNLRPGNSITLRTLMQIAAKRGWPGLSKINKKVYKDIRRWLKYSTGSSWWSRSVSRFLERFFKKLRGVPERDAYEEEVIIWEASRIIKDLFDVSYSFATLKRFWTYKLKSHFQESYSKSPPKALNGWVFLAYKTVQRFHNIFDKRELAPSGFNRVHSAALNVWLNQFYFVAGGKWWLTNLEGKEVLLSQIQTPTDFVLNYMRIPVCYGREYAPDQPDQSIVDVHGLPYLNTYIDSRPGMDEMYSEKAGKILTTHLERIIASEKARRHLLDFLAFNVQHPGKKVRHAIYFQGFQGVGKNWLAEMMKKVLGDSNVLIQNIDPRSNWDSWKTGNQLVFFDDFDLPYSKNAKRRAADKMKEPIADDLISVKRKSEERISGVKNVTNYIIFTDRSDALFISQGGGRYYCIQSSIRSRPQRERVLPQEYFDQIWAAIRQMPGAFRHFLSEYEISDDFDAYAPAPETRFQEELEEVDKPELQILIEGILSDGSGPLQRDLLSSKALKEALTCKGHTNYTDQYLADVLP